MRIAVRIDVSQADSGPIAVASSARLLGLRSERALAPQHKKKKTSVAPVCGCVCVLERMNMGGTRSCGVCWQLCHHWLQTLEYREASLQKKRPRRRKSALIFYAMQLISLTNVLVNVYFYKTRLVIVPARIKYGAWPKSPLHHHGHLSVQTGSNWDDAWEVMARSLLFRWYSQLQRTTEGAVVRRNCGRKEIVFVVKHADQHKCLAL